VRKIAKRFGVNPGTVQRISRPLESAEAALGGASAYQAPNLRELLRQFADSGYGFATERQPAGSRGSGGLEPAIAKRWGTIKTPG